MMTGIIAVFVIGTYEKEQKRMLANQQFTLISVLADEISQKLNTSHDALLQVARNIPESYFKDHRKLQHYIELNKALYALFHNILIYSDEGIILAANPQLTKYKGKDLSHLDYVQRTLEFGTPLVSDPFVSPVSKQPLIVMTAPIISKEGEVLGFMGGSQYFLKEHLLGNLLTAKLGKTGYFYISAKNRQILVHPNKKHILKVIDPKGSNSTYDAALNGFEGVREDNSSSSGQGLFGMKKLNFSNWLLTGVLPAEEAFLPIRNSRNRLILLMVAGAATTVCFVWAMLNFLLTPLTLLHQHIRAYTDNPDMEEEIKLRRKDEIGKLADDFNKMARSLSKSKEMSEKLIHSMQDGFTELDTSGVHINANPAFLNMTGFSKGEIIGTGVPHPYWPPEEMHSIESAFKKTKNDQQSDHELIFMKKSGERFPVIVSPSSLKDDHGNVIRYFATVKDITERKEYEKQIRQTSKMESVGNLAGGIAHEFNNMLAIIMGNNELISEEVPKESLAKESTEEIRIAGLRAREVVKQLLTFSRKDNVSNKVLDLKSVIQESMKLIRSTTPVNIKIEQKLLEGTFQVMGNDTQINQILINLCKNAVDALPENEGVITIELFNESIGTQQVQHKAKLPPGRYVKLIISDNGSGIEDGVIERVFEPYYTTKDVGAGTGIGLAVVHGIVEGHGGEIVVESKPGRGTSFIIYLPTHDGPQEHKSDEIDIFPVGDEHILYVDDEVSIANIGKRLLEGLGYTIETTTDPVKALDMVKNNPKKFDLLITDMAMPNMTGDQLIIETLKINRDIPTIICTGYSERISEISALDIGANSFIMKPVNKLELAKVVRKVLDDAKGPSISNH